MAALSTPWPDAPAMREADFARTLAHFMKRGGWSQNALGKAVGLNPSYLNRLCSGERDAPTRQVVAALARALRLTPEDADRLYFSAGHVPPGLQKLGPSDSTIAAVTRLLTDDRLSPERRADFRACVEVMAIRWSDGLPGVPSGALRAVGAGR